jgi:hypothetical protein
MILRELVRDESDPHYIQLEVANTVRQFGFLQSLVEIAKAKEQEWLSQGIIKALNYHALACLHDYAGQYRPCVVGLGDGSNDHEPRLRTPFLLRWSSSYTWSIRNGVSQIRLSWPHLYSGD